MAGSLIALLAACGGTSEESAQDCTVSVFAASSLSGALTEMKLELEEIVGCEISYKFGSSGSLAATVNNGVIPDVFISSGLNAVEDAGFESSAARPLVVSSLAIITKKGSEAGASISAVDNLLMKKWKFGLCSSTAPCGELADLVLKNAITVYGKEFDFSRQALADTEATSAADLLTKLQMDELDVVLGYTSSCSTNPELSCRVIPDLVEGQALGEKTTYYVIAAEKSTDNVKMQKYVSSAKFADRLVSDFGFEKLS
ncbi:MAG: hypothetical protein RL114_710 [Actinomycetota bacterium]|jgi:ABC-type molybdate transport system substrate-binding protein